MAAPYFPTIGELATLLLSENVVGLYRTGVKAIMVSQDHESTWIEIFKGRCESGRDGMTHTPRKEKRKKEEDVEEADPIRLKTMKVSKICLKAMFSLFKVAQDTLPKCNGVGCRFIHPKKKAEVSAKHLESQLREIKRKFFSESDMEALIAKAKGVST